MSAMGYVYLVGAGPGDRRFLTQEGMDCLGQAQVLVYDDLVDPSLLTLVPPGCQFHHVGKRGGQPSTPQTEINHLLVTTCRQGFRVVRLKSGDPFIFGRSQGEIAALNAAGCPWRAIPGLSSALVAPLLAGIALTDAEHSSVFGVVSGHDPDRLDWIALARLDTLVILMGGRTLGQIVAHLLHQGKDPTTPIALIRDAGRPQQRIWRSTLAQIREAVRGRSLSPLVIIIGAVAAQVLMSSALPLTDCGILVTRAAEAAPQFRELLTAQGARVWELPALEIVPPQDWTPLDRAIAQLDRYTWLILTSANGVEYFWQRLAQQTKDSRALAGLKIAVVGKKTAQYLRQRGIEPDFIPPDFVADALVEHFPEPLAGQRVLFPRVESGGREVLVQAFRSGGAEVEEVPAYQSRCPDRLDPAIAEVLRSGAIDVVTFASSKTVRHFHHLLSQAFGEETGAILGRLTYASIGPQTSQTCRELLGRVEIEATEYTLDGLAAAIGQWRSP